MVPVGFIPPASIRARCLRACRVYEARLIAGIVGEESDDAQAGAILEAEHQLDVRRTAETIEAFLKACRG
jgi:hypothetical protein